jgi:hypothetical protein
MNICTISQLNKTATLNDGSLFEISFLNEKNHTYASNAITFKNLNANLSAEINKSFATTYGLLNGTEPIKSLDLSASISTIMSSDISYTGVKTFNSSPIVPTPDATKLSAVANVDFVKSSAASLPNSFKADGIINAAITINNSIVSSDSKLMQFSLASITGSKWQSNSLSAADTGNLICYGWLADNGDFDPAQAWIALEGYISNNWVIIELKPWYRGTAASNLQYVSFNAPVTKGLNLRITTGFQLNNTTRIYQSSTNTLVYNKTSPGTWIANTFIGYIIS